MDVRDICFSLFDAFVISFPYLMFWQIGLCFPDRDGNCQKVDRSTNEVEMQEAGKQQP
jgi:hypothetical protein